MRARWMTALAAVAVVAVPAAAQAGGWATVSLSSTPDGVRAGEPWVVDIEVLQHGQTPLDSIRPEITIKPAGGGERQTIVARPTSRTGVYRAEVTFPTPGRWRYVVDDDFSQRHAYPPVRIGGSETAAAGVGAGVGTPSDGDDGLGSPILAALAAGLLAAGLTVALRRRRRDGSASMES